MSLEAPPAPAAPPAFSYDEVPYQSHPFPQSHPERMGAIAHLLGLKPAPIDKCRVLELGCAAGGNIIPIAAAYPDSEFVGIDLSERQIKDGQQMVDALGLKNAHLKHLSITDINEEHGKFDYIICHGVFSWIPKDVQDKVFSICQNSMNPEGVAYISYNVLPGWRMRGMIRDMMLYHARRFNTPREKVGQARALMDFLVKSLDKENSPYSNFLKSELELLQKVGDSYLYHEHLEDNNLPMYFHEFIERATAYQLRYLAESDLRVMVPEHFPAEVSGVLRKVAGDIVQIEQYMDFLRNRMFRQTLLCHAAKTPNYNLTPEQLEPFHIATAVKPESEKPVLNSNAPEKFKGPNELTITATEPLMKAALVELSEAWPSTIPFTKLKRLARARLNPNATILDAATVANDTKQLGHAFLRLYTTAPAHLVEMHLRPRQAASKPGKKPVAFPAVRFLATQGRAVTNVWHATVTIGDFERHVLQRLDGTRDRAALVKELTDLTVSGQLNVQKDGEAITDPEMLSKLLREALDQQLNVCARNGLLAE